MTIRPAICDKARKKQQGKPCPNPACQGVLETQVSIMMMMVLKNNMVMVMLMRRSTVFI